MSCHTCSIGKRPTSLGYEFILDTFSLSSRPAGATSRSVQVALEILATESNRESLAADRTARRWPRDRRAWAALRHDVSYSSCVALARFISYCNVLSSEPRNGRISRAQTDGRLQTTSATTPAPRFVRREFGQSVSRRRRTSQSRGALARRRHGHHLDVWPWSGDMVSHHLDKTSDSTSGAERQVLHPRRTVAPLPPYSAILRSGATAARDISSGVRPTRTRVSL